VLAYLLLGLAQAIGLLLIPFGVPGLWVQIAALALFGWWTDFATVGTVPLMILLVVGLAGELAEGPLTGGRIGRSARRWMGFAALAGGFAGAALGRYFPLVGSLFGAFVGSFLATAIAGFTLPGASPGSRFGQVLAITMKVAAGIVVATFALLSLGR
jgi:uncharacterized protein